MDTATRSTAARSARERLGRWRPTPTGVCIWLAVATGSVCRLWDLGTARLSADESYSAMAAQLPLGQIWGHVTATDPHPPLSYLLLAGPAHWVQSEAGLRTESALFAIAALALLAWWQRDGGLMGLVATWVFALAPFELFYGREARMYGLLSLAGVAAAYGASRWLTRPEGRWVAITIGAALVAAFSHSTGVTLLGVLVLVPGLRRDHDAWRFRQVVLAAWAGYGVIWLPEALRSAGGSSGYPTTSWSWVSIVLNETVAPVPDNRAIVLVLLGLGAVALARRPGPDRWVTACLGVLPLVGLVVIGFHAGVLIPKTLIVVGWAPALAIGALVAWAASWRPVAGVACAVVAVLVVVPYVGQTLSNDEGAGQMVDAVAAARRPGDAVAMSPAQLGTLLQWYLGVVPGHDLTADDRQFDDTLVLTEPGAEASGRIWWVEARGRAAPPRDDLARCADPVDVGGGYTLHCVRVAGQPRPNGRP